MDAHELADWMRAEHDRVLGHVDRLRTHTAVVPRSGRQEWISQARRRFDSFRAHLIKHMAMEEQGGYLTPVLDRQPTLSDEVNRLRHEHAEMTRIMADIHALLHDMTAADRILIRDSCARIAALISYVEHHEEQENLLVTYVFTQDIGSHD